MDKFKMQQNLVTNIVSSKSLPILILNFCEDQQPKLKCSIIEDSNEWKLKTRIS